jgi:Co/Zn/Cd efflux system component
MKHYSQISFGYMCIGILINLSPYTMLLIVCSILAAEASKRSILPVPSSQSLIHDTAAIVAEISFKERKGCQNKTVLQELYNYPR